MRRLIPFLLMLAFSREAFAGSSSVWWPGWRISSSEDLSEETKYSSYPLPLMFDGDPATAWVYSATQNARDTTEWPSRYAIALEPKRPVEVDGLRLMNGQNQSLARFQRNNRVTQIRVTLFTARKPMTRTFALPDRMGYHTVSWPRVRINKLRIQFEGIKRGRDNDICISELELFNSGRKVGWHLPRAVMFYDGTEGCTAIYLIARNGRVLDGIAADIGYADEWSQNNRYVCGYAGGGDNEDYLWVADTWRGRIIRRIANVNFGADYGWKGNTLHLWSTDKRKPFRRKIVLPS